MRLERLLPGLAAIVVLGACGGGQDEPAPACAGDEPSRTATYVNEDVAFAAPAGAELQSDRFDGPLPRFAKFGLHVRGEGTVVVRVPSGQRVRIVGWGGAADDAREAALVETASACWTAYPGGLAFAGPQCVRVQVEGPGEQRGSARFGLRRDC